MSTSARPAKSAGVSLVELIVFIVIVGVAMAGIFAAFNTITVASAAPEVRKQALAIAESLMEEVALMPFTFCDPDDPAAATAASTADCATVEAIGPEAGETRYSSPQFDNVNDYDAFNMLSGIKDITGALVPNLSAYRVTNVTVSQVGLGSGATAIAATEALRISITVTGPGGVSITLEGTRTRYAPNTLP